jgi:hypothetical protein
METAIALLGGAAACLCLCVYVFLHLPKSTAENTRRPPAFGSLSIDLSTHLRLVHLLQLVAAVQQDHGGLWQGLVARTAPAFQPIRAAVPEGPWKAFQLQVGWMLLLLAAKAAANRAIISKVQRTTLAPLAMQLENAERFFAQAAQAEAQAEAEAAAAAAGSSKTAAAGNPQRSSSTGGSKQQLQPSGAAAAQPASGQPAGAAAAAAASGALSSASASSSSRPAAASSGGSSSMVSPGGAGGGEDELLQAEVAFLGMMSRPPSSSQEQ